MNRERITRRNLPHWYMPGAFHFVTFRLAGTLPREVLDRLQQRKQDLLGQRLPGEPPASHRGRVHKLLFAEYDGYLDQNREINWLADARLAALVRSSLHYLHGKKYYMLAYAIMPNHVHVLFQPSDAVKNFATDDPPAPVGEQADRHSPLAQIMHSLKSYTAHRANEILHRSGTFWQHESYDHWVRDEEELERVIAYIAANPVRAGLASKPEDWFWSSAHERYLVDGDPCGWLLS